MPFILDDDGLQIQTLEEIQEEVKTELKARVSPLLDLSSESYDGQLIEILAERERILQERLQEILAGQDPDQAGGFQLKGLAKINGTIPRAATKSRVHALLELEAGDYEAGDLVAQVEGDSTKRFVNIEAVTSTGNPMGGGGSPAVLFECETEGPVVVNENTLEIAEDFLGWVGFESNDGTDAGDSTLGALAEGDGDLRARREDEAAGGGSQSAAAIRARLLRVSGVTAATVVQNDTDAAVGSQPAHSVAAYVRGGDDEDIAETLLEHKAPGIQAWGSTTVNVTDEQGQTVAIGYTIPSAVTIYISVTVVALSTVFTSTAAVTAAVREALLEAWDNGVMGKDVIRSRIIAVCSNIAGVVDVTACTLGTSASPAGTSNIVMALSEYSNLADDGTGIVVTPSLVSAEP